MMLLVLMIQIDHFQVGRLMLKLHWTIKYRLQQHHIQIVSRIGSSVVLKSLANINEILATGIVDEMENVRVNGIDLGTDFCKVVIQYQVKKDARLIFPHNHIQTIGSALGVPIAWPLSLVALDDEFHM